MTKMLPCPFCQGEPMVTIIPPFVHNGMLAKFMPECSGATFVECPKCGCGMAGDNVINRWNNRNPNALEQQQPERTMEEPDITINGKKLTTGQAMAVRVAVSNYRSQMQDPNASGDDEHGRAMATAYKDRLTEVIRLFV